LSRRVRAPPGIVILAPPEVPRNASEARAQSEGRAGKDRKEWKKRGQGHYKGRDPEGPRPVNGERWAG
jgi:hypothetical protein